jgi:hypothetical protein
VTSSPEKSHDSDQLQTENERLRGALEFYATAGIWSDYEWDRNLHCYSLIVAGDKGERARRALLDRDA